MKGNLSKYPTYTAQLSLWFNSIEIIQKALPQQLPRVVVEFSGNLPL